jgi:hypothetical protein
MLSATLSGRPEGFTSMIQLAAAEDAPDDRYAGVSVGAGQAEISLRASSSSAIGDTVADVSAGASAVEVVTLHAKLLLDASQAQPA